MSLIERGPRFRGQMYTFLINAANLSFQAPLGQDPNREGSSFQGSNVHIPN